MNVYSITVELCSSGGWFFVIPASVDLCQIAKPSDGKNIKGEIYIWTDYMVGCSHMDYMV